MSNWSQLKYHSQSGHYYRYKESGLEVHLFEAKTPQALSVGGSGCHNHYFRVNNRWYVQHDIENQYLFKRAVGGSIEPVGASEQLNCLLNELKTITASEPMEVPQAVTMPVDELKLNDVLKLDKSPKLAVAARG